MSTLISLFDQNRPRLEEIIAKDKTPEKVYQHSREFLDNLKHQFQNLPDVHPNQIGVAPYLFDILQSAIALLIVVKGEKVLYPKNPHDEYSIQPSNQQLRNVVFRIGQLFLMISLLAGIWSEQKYIWVILLVLITIIEIGILTSGRNFTKKSRLGVKKRDIGSEPVIILQTDLNSFIQQLRDLIITVNKTLNEVVVFSDPKEVKSYLEEDSQILDLFQSLLQASETQNVEFAMAQIESIPLILHTHGIAIHSFEYTNRNLFEIIKSPNPNDQDYRTIKPALTKNDIILKLGRVTSPAKEQAR